MNHVPLTFAIITSGADQARLATCVDSVRRLGIPDYEVLIVGGTNCEVAGPDVRHVPFDEAQGRPGWITRKKNLATQQARHELVVYYHDYHVFDADWYEQFCAFGTDWDICQHRILCVDGTRFFGWAILDHPTLPRYFNVPFERHDLIGHMYISGGYWVARRQVMLEAPLDERLYWGEAEDVEWSLRVRDRYRIRANSRCVVRHLKAHAGLAFCKRMALLEPAFEALLARTTPVAAAAV